MAPRGKVAKPAKPKAKNPTGVRLTERQKTIARQAAKLETDRRHKKVGWTTLVTDKGIEWCVRRVRRAVKDAAAA